MRIQLKQHSRPVGTRRVTQRNAKWILLPVVAGVFSLLAGCRTQTADASDPDPRYYKGADFHGKHKKA